MNTVRTLGLILLMFGTAACQEQGNNDMNDTAMPERTATDNDADRRAVEQIDAAYERGMQAGDAASIVALHAEDAVVLPPNETILRGRGAIAAAFDSVYAEGHDAELTAEQVVVSEAGDLAYIVGSFSAGGQTGKYLTVLRRTGGEWKIVADTWNMDHAPEGSATSN